MERITPEQFFSMYGINDPIDRENIKTLCVLFNGKVTKIYEKTKTKEVSPMVVSK